MAKRTIGAIADLIEDRLDKDRADVTFDTFVFDMLNLTLQEMSSYVPYARWLMDEVSLTATVSGTQYIVMPTDMDIDSLIYIRDTTTNKRVRRVSPMEAETIDPGRDLTGDEMVWWYQRVETTSPPFEDRIYFLDRPDSADTLTAIFGILVPVASTAATQLILPEKYEWILMEGAMAKIRERMDSENIALIQMHEANYKRGIKLLILDADNQPSHDIVMASHRPVYGSGISGASFPSDYDITA